MLEVVLKGTTASKTGDRRKLVAGDVLVLVIVLRGFLMFRKEKKQEQEQVEKGYEKGG